LQKFCGEKVTPKEKRELFIVPRIVSHTSCEKGAAIGHFGIHMAQGNW
jgi:hypothetical protein